MIITLGQVLLAHGYRPPKVGREARDRLRDRYGLLKDQRNRYGVVRPGRWEWDVADPKLPRVRLLLRNLNPN